MKKIISIIIATTILLSVFSIISASAEITADETKEQGTVVLEYDDELDASYTRTTIGGKDFVNIYITSLEYNFDDPTITVNDLETDDYQNEHHVIKNSSYGIVDIYKLIVEPSDNIKVKVTSGSIKDKYRFTFDEDEYLKSQPGWYSCKDDKEKAVTNCEVEFRTDKNYTIETHFYVSDKELTDVDLKVTDSPTSTGIYYTYSFTVGLKERVRVVATSKAIKPSTETTQPTTETVEPTTESTQPPTEIVQPTTSATEQTESTEPATTVKEPKVKMTNPIKVTAKTKTIKVKKLKKSKVTVKALTVKNAKGEVKYKKLSGSTKLNVNKKGEITVKKGTKTGNYKVKIKVTAKGTKNYKSKTVTKKVTIKVK